MTPAQKVRVRPLAPPGHVRTPAYLRGRTGIVERVLGTFPNPEDLAYRQPGTPRLLVRVRFRMGDLWPGTSHPDDTLDAEVYAHWLEKAD
jgi:nitrile hydratase